MNSTNFISSLLDHGFDVMGACDERGRLLHINVAVQRLLGRSPAKLVGTSLVRLLHPEDRPLVKEAIRASAELSVTPSLLLRLRHADGRWVPVELLGRLWQDEAGKPLWLLHLRDITARRKGDDLIRLERDLMLAFALCQSP